MKKEDALNPDFKITSFYGMKSLTKDEILAELEKSPFIYREFKKDGIITSKKYSFITKVTFSETEKNCVDNTKTDDEKLQAIEILRVVEDYFNNRYIDKNNHNLVKLLRMEFTSRHDHECAIYNPDKYDTCDKLNNKLIEIFGLK